MSRKFKGFLLKVFGLTTIIVVTFSVGINLLSAKETLDLNNVTEQKTNKDIYENTNNSKLGKTGVAITTNIGIRYKQRTEIPATIYKDVFSVNSLILNGETGSEELIAGNMIILEEYKNVLKTDIKGLLANSRNRAETLDAIIGQLEFRYEKSVKQIMSLNEQKNIFSREMVEANAQTEVLKTKINTDYKNRDAKASKENINNYLEQKNKYNYARTYVIYINQFLKEYALLNDYNKKLLDTLINNKTAIIKEAYVVIPDTGVSLLKEFDLLYDENEYKSQK
ncbi:MAG: hypothetical protein PHH06_02715 [Candidatus Gracilibacteria bacterium]|nr:hypothetical protein [Candidatus Gracilibacteria bacterium]